MKLLCYCCEESFDADELDENRRCKDCAEMVAAYEAGTIENVFDEVYCAVSDTRMTRIKRRIRSILKYFGV